MVWTRPGRGLSRPGESQLIGRYSSTVWDQYHPYVRAQETGNHCDVRWLSLTDANGSGLLVEETPLSMSGHGNSRNPNSNTSPPLIERRHGGGLALKTW